MSAPSIHIGKQELIQDEKIVEGNYVEINEESFYKISNYDKMDPFFISIVSGSDHWMYISSKGGLTAGRKNPDNALFPYYTDDKIHDSQDITGSKTILRIGMKDAKYLWEPFSDRYANLYRTTRNIYKNIPSNKIIFEEINHDLNLTFCYSWLNSEKYGFVKKSTISNQNSFSVKIESLDGIQNILPFGVYQKFQNELSTLADGYKKNELINKYNIGVYSLSSIPSDKAEPSESLKATCVWSSGAEFDKYLLSSRQLNNFRAGKELVPENDIRAARGAYFVFEEFDLASSVEKDWIIVAEINQDSADVENLKETVKEEDIYNKVLKDIEYGTKELIKIVASADGIQSTNSKLNSSRHFSNVLFNVMRGGILDNGYFIEKKDFISFLKTTNRRVLKKHEDFLMNLEEQLIYEKLLEKIDHQNDYELTKLSFEYLPITFSRRHGDPSRPWNRFSIDIKDQNDRKILNYQGNWRDLFQNWEALALSFPGYIESMITKFLNASTADGYNPYRVTRDGFDWEKLEPDMPWSNIGYWGDHQIVYLLKLLEVSQNYNPTSLSKYLTEQIYAYANVPYRIKSYHDLVADPQNTVDFDWELDERITEQEEEYGSDARFLKRSDGSLYQVNLTEKLLITLLTKLSNFVPGGGVWMNTQRPEWNDANNALVGNGVSMVTLYYMRRYISFCLNLYAGSNLKSIGISKEVNELFNTINEILLSNKSLLQSKISNKHRKAIVDRLGIAGSEYRENIYTNGFSESKSELSIDGLIKFFDTSLEYIDQSIEENERPDGLYHAYNLITFEEDELIISHLYEMLEGQVAVLSSKYLSTEKSIRVIKSLRESKLYRKDQHSYVLYPDRQLPLFNEKNHIDEKDFIKSKLLQILVKNGNDSIIVKDNNNNKHFNGDIKNSNILRDKLAKLTEPEYKSLINDEEDFILDTYETMFNHKSFTGRSGTFYKYEGLGCIYWHMVSKLLLAVQETYYNSLNSDANESQLQELKKYYYEIKDGIGVIKNPADYGAFPTDPYSHTPSFAGVQQPGMTGQVKEDIISRFGELGVIVNNGMIQFNPKLLNSNEFMMNDSIFTYIDIKGNEQRIELEKESIAFTYCQLPFIYTLGNNNKVFIYKSKDEPIIIDGLVINKEQSKEVFDRTGSISKIVVEFRK